MPLTSVVNNQSRHIRCPVSGKTERLIIFLYWHFSAFVKTQIFKCEELLILSRNASNRGFFFLQKENFTIRKTFYMSYIIFTVVSFRGV